MGDGFVGEAVVIEEVISLWGEAESGSGSRSRSRSKSKAAGESPASTRANSTQAEQKLTPKQLGEIAEAEFIAKAVGLGFVVAKPWGDSEPYDFIVNPKKSFYFWRVQVKSAHTIGADGGCSFRAHDHLQRSYSAEDIDALVAYARPMNAWYVMPVRVVEELKSLMLYPESKKLRSRFERWREKWEVLRRAVRRARRK
jgi:PD-(D/E)XK endonuclease